MVGVREHRPHTGGGIARIQCIEPDLLVSKFVGQLSATPFAEGRRYSASSVARALAAVRMFHLFLVREGETDANAAEGVVRPKVPRTEPSTQC